MLRISLNIKYNKIIVYITTRILYYKHTSKNITDSRIVMFIRVSRHVFEPSFSQETALTLKQVSNQMICVTRSMHSLTFTEYTV